MLFDHPDYDGHDEVSFACDPESGLRALIAIHDNTRELALGGCRMRPYADETEALTDVLRLSAGMSRKAAVVDMPFGGGKAVVWGDPGKAKSPELLRALGRALKRFEGRFMTGEDMCMEREDFLIVGEETDNLVGVERQPGWREPGLITAMGVMRAIDTALEVIEPGAELSKMAVAVQGLGHVGRRLCELLSERGARVVVADIDEGRIADVVDKIGAERVAADAIYDVDADIFAPCAMGGALTAKTAERLRCRLVAGAANNQLASPAVADRLHARGVTYVPDYVANAGGLIRVGYEALARRRGEAFDEARAVDELSRVTDAVRDVLVRARADGRSPYYAAEARARSRMRAAHAVPA